MSQPQFTRQAEGCSSSATCSRLAAVSGLVEFLSSRQLAAAMAGLRRNFQPLKPSMGASFQAPPTAVAHPPAEPTVVINNTVEIGGSGIVGGVDLLVRKLTSADREGQRGSRSILLASALAVLLVATMAKHGPSPLALMGTVYAVERLATEWWKAIVREQDQSRHHSDATRLPRDDPSTIPFRAIPSASPWPARRSPALSG